MAETGRVSLVAQLKKWGGALVVSSLLWAAPQVGWAEGSADFYPSGTNSTRAAVFYKDDAPQGIHRRSPFNVYVDVGDTILAGHSAYNTGSGAIEMTKPDGTGITCEDAAVKANNVSSGTAAEYAIITDRTEELGGPDIDPTTATPVGNYSPCTVFVGAGEAGVWRVWMIPSDDTSNVFTTAVNNGANNTWNADANPSASVSAWDITVLDGSPGVGSIVTGRVYFNSLYMAASAFTQQVDLPMFVKTKDGHVFEVNMIDTQPFGFALFANNKGILEADGVTASFQSNAGVVAGTDFQMHDPLEADDDANNLITYKIFFNTPDTGMPASASIAGNAIDGQDSVFTANQTTWLNTSITAFNAPTDLKFVGNTNVRGLSEVGQGGTFSFTAAATGTATLILDLNENGTYGDGNDRVLNAGTTSGQSVSITWDGKDGNGTDVAVGVYNITIKNNVNVSESHFPVQDMEASGSGFEVKLNSTALDVYYDDSPLLPLPSASDTDPTDGLAGEDSSGGGHSWPVPGNVEANSRGQNTTIDTWASVIGASASSSIGITVTNVGETLDPVILKGTVWYDADSDRVVDSSEDKFSGCTVELKDSGGTVQQTTTTDANGDYQFSTWDNFVNGDAYDVVFSCDTYGAGSTVSNNNAGTSGNGTITGITLNFGSTVTGQDLPLDPSGRFYDADTREPVAGVTSFLFANGTQVPDACVSSGQQGQVSGTDGRYRFDIIDFGAGCPGETTYTIVFTVPTGYEQRTSNTLTVDARTLDATNCTASGTTIDTVAGDPCRVQTQETVPTGAASTLYFITFALASGDQNVIHNHIPLDATTTTTTTANIFATKTTPITRTTRGSRVPYTITYTNRLATAFTDLTFLDRVPPGFKYVANTATIDDVAVEPVTNGRLLSWTGQSMAANGSVTVKLVLTVGSGVGEGVYTNETWVQDNTGTVVSNVAEASVVIVADPLFDCTDVIGKVFDDVNGNGYQDRGEPGLPGVKLAVPTGLRVTTDRHGRYHITCADVPQMDRGSNFAIKVMERTLPSGYSVTSENPRVVRLTRGKMVKANFGASAYRMIRLTLDDRAFVKHQAELLPEYDAGGLDKVLESVHSDERPAIVRLNYQSNGETPGLIRARLEYVQKRLTGIWEDKGRDQRLTLETAKPELEAPTGEDAQ